MNNFIARRSDVDLPELVFLRREILVVLFIM